MFKCTKCGEEKSQDQFPKRLNRSKPVISFCIECRREYARDWYKNNIEKSRSSSRKSYFNNRDKNLLRIKNWRITNQEIVRSKAIKYYYENLEDCRERSREYAKNNHAARSEYYKKWRLINLDYIKIRSKNWSNNNKTKIRMYYNQRQEYIRLATPVWVDMNKIEEIYEECYRQNVNTGINHEVDHIVPLKHKFVCGLHVPKNLQILTASENSRKGNRFNVQL